MIATLANGRQIFFERDPEFTQAEYVDCCISLTKLIKCLRFSDHWMPDHKIEKPAKLEWWQNSIDKTGIVATPLITLTGGGHLKVGQGRHRMAVLEALGSDFVWFCCEQGEKAGILIRLSEV